MYRQGQAVSTGFCGLHYVRRHKHHPRWQCHILKPNPSDAHAQQRRKEVLRLGCGEPGGRTRKLPLRPGAKLPPARRSFRSFSSKTWESSSRDTLRREASPNTKGMDHGRRTEYFGKTEILYCWSTEPSRMNEESTSPLRRQISIGYLPAGTSNTSRSRVTPNPSLKLSTNGVSRWSSGAGPAAQFAPAAQRATPLAPA